MAFEISSQNKQKKSVLHKEIMEIPKVSFRVQFDGINGLKGKESIHIRCGNMPNSSRGNTNNIAYNTK